MKKFFTLILLLCTFFTLYSCAKAIEFPDTELGNLLPKIEANGEIISNNSDTLYISLDDISESSYKNYVEQCKNQGFTTDSTEKVNEYIAHNSNGYKIKLNYFSNGNMWIDIDAPISMSTIQWPSSDIAKLIPIPDSDYGKIEWEADYGFYIYVGNITKEQYKDYVSKVSSVGFTEDYQKGDDFYYADNIDGYHVSIGYEGYNIMHVEIHEPREESEDFSATVSDVAEESSGTSIETSTHESKPNDDTNDNKLFFWNRAGNGCGELVPHPTHEYDILMSSDCLYAEVKNITEEDFYEYARECINRGFDGDVKSASMPDLYLRADNADGYGLELRYYKDEAYFSVYVSQPSDN